MTGYARLTIVALTESVLPSDTWEKNQWWNHYRTGMCMHCRLKKYLLLSRLVVAWSDKNNVKSEISAWWSQNIDSASPNTQHYSQFFIWSTSKFRLLSCLPIFKNGTTPHIWMTYTYTMTYTKKIFSTDNFKNATTQFNIQCICNPTEIFCKDFNADELKLTTLSVEASSQLTLSIEK